jgi:hypothetical protein
MNAKSMQIKKLPAMPVSNIHEPTCDAKTPIKKPSYAVLSSFVSTYWLLNKKKDVIGNSLSI